MLKRFRSRIFIRFLIAGIVNTFLSNYILLILLSSLTVGSATFVSQIFHAVGGYLASKYGVFNRSGSPILYALLVFFSWVTQWFLLKTMIDLSIRPIFAISILIPILATTSFLTQKTLIFK